MTEEAKYFVACILLGMLYCVLVITWVVLERTLSSSKTMSDQDEESQLSAPETIAHPKFEPDPYIAPPPAQVRLSRPPPPRDPSVNSEEDEEASTHDSTDEGVEGPGNESADYLRAVASTYAMPDLIFQGVQGMPVLPPMPVMATIAALVAELIRAGWRVSTSPESTHGERVRERNVAFIYWPMQGTAQERLVTALTPPDPLFSAGDVSLTAGEVRQNVTRFTALARVYLLGREVAGTYQRRYIPTIVVPDAPYEDASAANGFGLIRATRSIILLGAPSPPFPVPQIPGYGQTSTQLHAAMQQHPRAVRRQRE